MSTVTVIASDHISSSLHLTEDQRLIHETSCFGVLTETTLEWELSAISSDDYKEVRSFKITGPDHARVTIQQLKKYLEFLGEPI